MTDKHTRTPWSTDDVGRIRANVLLPAMHDPEGKGTMLTLFVPASIGGLIDDETMKENARRIIACVNACDGIPSNEIERGSIIILAGATSTLWDGKPAGLLHITNQRDKLMKALEKISDMEGTERDEWDAVDRLIPEIVAIAKAALANKEEQP